jgi:hypothetical protein
MQIYIGVAIPISYRNLTTGRQDVDTWRFGKPG